MLFPRDDHQHTQILRRSSADIERLEGLQQQDFDGINGQNSETVKLFTISHMKLISAEKKKRNFVK